MPAVRARRRSRRGQNLNEYLANQPAARRAERGTDRQLVRARQRSRQHEIGDVGRNHQQDQNQRADEDRREQVEAL